MRPLTVLLIALTALAAWHLTRLRPQREIFIQGRLTLASNEPVEGAQVDVILVFPETKLKITSQGRQLVALRTLGAGEQWQARPDPAAYNIEWGPAGDFDINLKVRCPSKPRRCRLVYHLVEIEIKSPRFRLRGEESKDGRWTGFCPDQILSALPHAIRTRSAPSAAPQQEGNWEEKPEQDMAETGSPVAEDVEIRQRAELTLQRINTLSPVALRVRLQLLRYLEQNPVYARSLPNRTRRIGILMRNILDRRLALLDILRSGQAIWVGSGRQSDTLLSDPDENEAEESAAEDTEQDSLDTHQEGTSRFED